MADRYQGRPNRADDDYDRAHRQSSPQQGENDPLAELARLIGQTDPFSNFGREAREAHHYAASEDDRRDQSQPVVETSPGPPSWMQRVAQREAPPPSYNEPSHDDQAYAEEHTAAHYHQEPQGYPPPRYNEAYEQPDPARYDNVLYGAADDGGDPRDQHASAYPQDAYGEGYGDEIADEPVRSRRGGMMTVVAVLALAFIGTAGAYAYRTFSGSPRTGEAPIIKAEAGPNKIVPPTQSGDATGKLIQDRVGTGPGSERIVSREEQPVDLNNAKPGARVVFPPLAQNPNPASVSASAAPIVRPAANGAASGNFAGDEPRKVRTLSIRPDQTDTPSAATPPGKQAASTASVSNARAATMPVAPAASAPVSLSPQTTPPQAVAPARTAFNPPPATPAATGSAGGYLVQISSQRSEADAQASYRALQGKFPAVLGSRPPLIKRADLGEKGIYYRAMVGPFGTSEEASQLCGSLKTAGGQCVVQRN